MADNRLWFACLCAVVLLAVAVVGAWLPLRVRVASHTGGRLIFYHLGSCFAAGVMLSAGVVHLLAMSAMSLMHASDFPLAHFLAALGFLLTLTADQIAQALSGPGTPAACHSIEMQPSDAVVVLRLAEEPDKEGSAGGHHGAVTVPLLAPPTPAISPPPNATGKGALSTRSACEAPKQQAAQTPFTHPHGNEDDDAQEEDLLVVSMAANSRMAASQPVGVQQTRLATALLFAAMLCVHSALEGMAMGAQQSLREAQDLLLASAAHKGLTAYALGTSVAETGASTRSCWLVMAAFVLSTPVAVLVGYGLRSVSHGEGSAVLSALAAGTFIYVAVMEVLPRQLPASSQQPLRMRLAKVACVLLGFAAMSVLALWT